MPWDVGEGLGPDARQSPDTGRRATRARFRCGGTYRGSRDPPGSRGLAATPARAHAEGNATAQDLRQRRSDAASSAVARRHRGRRPRASGRARSDRAVGRFRVLGWCTPARRSTACTSDLVRVDMAACATLAFNPRGEAPTTRRPRPTSETSHARRGPASRGTEGAACVLGVRLRNGPRLQHRRASPTTARSASAPLTCALGSPS